MNKILTYSVTLVASALIAGCGVQLQSVSSGAAEGSSTRETSESAASAQSNVVYRFFDDDYVAGGYSYAYPEGQSNAWITEDQFKLGEVSVQMDLVPTDWSGGAICLWNMSYNLTPYYETGALQFWIKGKNGGEVFNIQLLDAESPTGNNTAVAVPSTNYGELATEWQQFTIPLRDFGPRGSYWDARKGVEVNEAFKWDEVMGFRITIDQNANREFTIWVDDINIVSNAVEAVAQEESTTPEFWDEIEETLPVIPVESKPAVNVLAEIIPGDVPAGGWAYEYGGMSAYAVQNTEDYKSVFASYLDNSDFSGVTVSLGMGTNLDLTEARSIENSAIAFWGKAAEGLRNVHFGIGDDESNGQKVMTRVNLANYGISSEWTYFVIPLSDFPETGTYWDADNGVEVPADMDWENMNEFRFSVNVGENRMPSGDPASFYIHDMAVITLD
ncbi:hypothetical protein CHISP_0851 [Chitinispirillum alkaliphilum]|nr:hypothetical protein CHISP_0851 [Chitinispirillum alkaliphilum]